MHKVIYDWMRLWQISWFTCCCLSSSCLERRLYVPLQINGAFAFFVSLRATSASKGQIACGRLQCFKTIKTDGKTHHKKTKLEFLFAEHFLFCFLWCTNYSIYRKIHQKYNRRSWQKPTESAIKMYDLWLGSSFLYTTCQQSRKLKVKKEAVKQGAAVHKYKVLCN